jgi:hypothetical protein
VIEFGIPAQKMPSEVVDSLANSEMGEAVVVCCSVDEVGWSPWYMIQVAGSGCEPTY